LDGIDVRQLSVNWLRSQIGLVSQEPVLFNTSIRENIRYGHEEASDENVKRAAEQAYAHQFIMKLPKVNGIEFLANRYFCIMINLLAATSYI
jgi:ATP-binding cassette, subfamily B (MDR/TAP), member 1